MVNSLQTSNYNRVFDNLLVLQDAAEAAITSAGTTTGQVGGADAELDVGAAAMNGTMVVDVTSLDLGGTDESYILVLQGGDVAAFTVNQELARLHLGVNEVLESTLDSVVGRYKVPFSNEKGGVIYPFVRLRVIVAGTTPSIDCEAFISKA